MCGRYVSVKASTDLLEEFQAVDNTEKSVEPDFNVAPQKQVRVVVNREPRDEKGDKTGEPPVRQLRVVTWGLVPSWSKDRKIGNRLINARAETVAKTNAFRSAYKARRCLVPADGWYEWQRQGGTKQAFYMTPADGHTLAFAGLYEFWGEPGELLTTCTVITVDSAGALAEIHDRMPLVLPRDAWERWLDPGEQDPSDLLKPWDEAEGEHLELRPVSDQVNNVRHNGPDLIKFAEPAVEPQKLF